MERLKLKSGRAAKDEEQGGKHKTGPCLINLVNDVERSTLISFWAEAVTFRHFLFNNVYITALGLPAADIQQCSI
jgi:hypothetical protein